MNKSTYKAIDAAHKRLTELTLDETTATSFSTLLNLPALKDMAENAREDWDNKSERWQESETGQEENDRINSLESMVVELEDVIAILEAAHGYAVEIITDAPEGSFN